MKYEWIDKDKIKVFVEKDYDLFVLFKILNPGDIIEGYDYRTIKINNKKEKIKVYLKIEIEDIKFSEYSNSLRVQGKILEKPEIVTGKYHTFDIRIGSQFIINKKFSKYELEELEKASKSEKNILIISLDDSNICLAKLERNRYKIIMENEINVSKEKKEEIYNKILSEFYKKIIEENPDFLIVIGPIFYPDKIYEKVKDKIKTLKFKVSSGCENGIREFLRRKEYLDSLKEVEIAEINIIIQDFIRNMVKDFVVLGLEKVKEYSSYGNLEYILLSYNFFKKMKEEGRIKEILEILENVEKNKGKIYFVYDKNENFELIDRFGIVGKIRYKVEE